jgi:hypothetical protein
LGGASSAMILTRVPSARSGCTSSARISVKPQSQSGNQMETRARRRA